MRPNAKNRNLKPNWGSVNDQGNSELWADNEFLPIKVNIVGF